MTKMFENNLDKVAFALFVAGFVLTIANIFLPTHGWVGTAVIAFALFLEVPWIYVAFHKSRVAKRRWEESRIKLLVLEVLDELYKQAAKPEEKK